MDILQIIEDLHPYIEQIEQLENTLVNNNNAELFAEFQRFTYHITDSFLHIFNLYLDKYNKVPVIPSSIDEILRLVGIEYSPNKWTLSDLYLTNRELYFINLKLRLEEEKISKVLRV